MRDVSARRSDQAQPPDPDALPARVPDLTPQGKGVLEARLGGVEVAKRNVQLTAECLRPGDEGGHPTRLGLRQGPVEEVKRVLDLPAQEVVAAEQRERLSERLAGSELQRALHTRAQRLAGRSVVAEVVARGSADHVDPRQLLLPARGQVGRALQRVFRALVLRAQELDPADLAPARCRDVVPAGRLGERRAFVEGRRAFLIRSARGVHKGAAERHKCLGEELAIADIASGCDCLAHPLDAGFDRPRPEGRLACLEDGKDGGSP